MSDLAGDNGGRRGLKSRDAFRTISEVASDLDVPQHVLRFWETKFNQIRPLKRGGGRRYYRPEDVDLLRRIRTLLYTEGYTIKGVQKVLRENGGRGGLEPARLLRSAASDEPPSRSSGPATNLGLAQRRELHDILLDLEALRALLRNHER